MKLKKIPSRKLHAYIYVRENVLQLSYHMWLLWFNENYLWKLSNHQYSEMDEWWNERMTGWNGRGRREMEKKNGDHVKNNTYTLNYMLCYTIYTHTFGIIVACTLFCKTRQMFEMIFPNWNRPKKNSQRFRFDFHSDEKPDEIIFSLSTRYHPLTCVQFRMYPIDVRSCRRIVYHCPFVSVCMAWHGIHIIHYSSKSLIHRNFSAIYEYIYRFFTNNSLTLQFLSAIIDVFAWKLSHFEC